MVIISYIIVSFIGLIVGFIEIVSIFESKATLALSQRKAGAWAWGIIVFNGCMNILVFALLMYLTDGWNPIFLSLIVGFGLPILMRTRFTFIKTPEGKNELILNVEWIYEQIQKLFKTQIDNAMLASGRQLKILERFQGRKQLYNFVYTIIQSSETLSPTKQEKEEKLKLADEFYKLSNSEIARVKLSLLLIEVGGVQLVETLEQMRESEVLSEKLIERVTRELPQNALKEIAEEIASAADTEETKAKLQKYIEDVMADSASDAMISAVLANFIVYEGGQEFARWALERWTQQKDDVVYSLERKQRTPQ
ncbi:TPA: hypothetical protein EYP66_17705 [Candidatus Poribacteria bacterium]|nr:hypothetical protein [Candidatus Poribacteria bacterium]